MKARHACWWFVTFLITAFFLSVGAQAAQKDFQKLTIGYTPISGAAIPFFIAVEEKSFKNTDSRSRRYSWEGRRLLIRRFLLGNFPLAIREGARSSSRLAGSDLIVIGSPLPVLTIDGWAKPEIKSVSDLRGKRVGVTRFGASSYFAGLSMLESAGIKPSEVTFIQNGGVGESYAALLGGRVDVCMIGYPFGLRAKREGFHLLFRPSDTEYGMFPTAVIGARESWLKDGKNRKFAIDFLRALSEGQRLARENAAVTKKALGKFARTENDAELQGSFEFYKDAFSSTLRTADKSMANALKFVEHPKAKGADVKQFYDNSLVEEAMK